MSHGERSNKPIYRALSILHLSPITIQYIQNSEHTRDTEKESDFSAFKSFPFNHHDKLMSLFQSKTFKKENITKASYT